MKKYLMVAAILLVPGALKAQNELTMNPNNKAYYSRYYDAPPRFPDMYIGGIFQYISDHVQYPDKIQASISGQINIHAIVDTNGAVTDPLLVRSVSPEIDRAVLNVLTKIPRSQPAMYKGHKVPVFLAVVMNISVDADNKTIKATRDVQAQMREMLLAKKVYDVKPGFTADHNNLYKYVADNIKYPVEVSSDVDGIVKLHFIIDTLGKLKNITILKTLSKEADQALIDALNEAPDFTPGMLGIKKVTVGFTFSMGITINTATKTIIAKQLPPPPPNVNATANASTRTTLDYNSSNGPDQIFTAVEINPEYPGGEQAFAKYLQANIVYPFYAKKNHVQGTVYIQFVVERDGTLTDVKVVRSPSDDLANEARRVIQTSPHWKPGVQDGKPVRVQYTVPISFNLGS